MIAPARLDEAMLFDQETYILDVRPQFLRKNFKSLPNAHELSFVAVEKYLAQLPGTSISWWRASTGTFRTSWPII